MRLFVFLCTSIKGEEKKEFPIFDNQIITESYMQGIVKYRIPDMLLSYEGKVDANVYIDFPDGSHTDNLAFTFNIEKSIIDGDVQLNGEYYFKDFQQLLDGVKQEATDAVNAALTNVDSTIEKANQQINEFVEGATQAIDQTVDEVTEQLQATQTKIDTVSQNVASAQNNLKAVEDKMNQTNQQIGDLGKLKKMYSNSIDFGDNDYSGNPNLMSVIKASDFKTESDVSVSDVGYNSIRLTSQGIDRLSVLTQNNIPSLVSGKTYTISAKVKIEEGATGNIDKLRISYRKTNGGTMLLYATTKGVEVAKEITIKGTGIVTYEIKDLSRFYLTIDTEAGAKMNGSVIVSDVKIEEGSTATPYQPNLLDAPYYLSKIPLGENILKPASFPINTTEYMAANFTPNEPYVQGQKYTFTMKASKPSTQTFGIYLRAGSLPVGNMVPVEGLADVWQLTFEITQSHIDGSANALNVFQAPQSTKGTVNIEWAKLEKGDTRTPNISQFKYFGEGLKDSNNPNDYSWDITPEYTEKGLNDSVSLTEPQSVDGTKNFLETPLVNGKNVLVEEKPLPYEAWHSTGTEQTGISNKARLIIGPVATTIGAKLNRSMKENPLTWNSGNWQATANRDCTLLVEGLVRYQFGGSTAGQYGYITFYKDDAQNSSIGFAGGVGINGTALQWKHGLHFSRIFALKKGEYFNITFETQDGKKLDFSQINTLHIMEIES